MNFNRISLKTRAKQILRKNWGWIILVTFIFSLTTPTVSSSFIRDEARDFFKPTVHTETIQTESNGDVVVRTQDRLYKYRPDVIIREYKKAVEEAIRMVMPGYQGSIWPIVIMTAFISILLAAALKIFVLNPINVGCCKWYLKNRSENKPKLRVILEVFSKGYIRIVGVMLVRDVFLFLWFLLLIVPGLIKSYEYRMIPYLLAENPDLTVSEAFELTRKIMDGNKMDAFVLDLSFLPWIILAIITCGILNIVYVGPYIKLTDTELYVCLCQGKEKYEMS